VLASALGFAVAVFSSGVVDGEVMLGMVAAAFTLPVVGITALFATRRNLRLDWRKAKPETRQVLVASFGIEVSAAIILWSIFLVVTLHR
jgi:hypothetical protein